MFTFTIPMTNLLIKTCIIYFLSVQCRGLKFQHKHETPKVIAFHKPPGVVTSNVRQDDRPTVFEYVNDKAMREAGIRGKIHTVGRLDADTSGLLLFTNDSLLVHAATNPSAKVTFNDISSGTSRDICFQKLEKQYTALIMGTLSEESVAKLRSGINLGEKLGVTLPAIINILDNPSPKSTLASIVITEGKNRQVRRMFHAVNSGVIKLHRTRIGNIELGDLREGDYRILSGQEIENDLNWPIRVLRVNKYEQSNTGKQSKSKQKFNKRIKS